MRIAAALAVTALVGCGNHASKLDVSRGADVDRLWDLAPDGTRLGIVASPRAIGMALRGIETARGLVKPPDLAPAKVQLDVLTGGMFGSADASAADAGLSADKPFAMFETSDGVIGVMPVIDRDKFIGIKHGTRGSGDAGDKIESMTCKPIKDLYVCATSDAMFARIGKASLRGKASFAGARGDAELWANDVPLVGEAKGELALAVQLEPGQVSVYGKWRGKPDGVLSKLVGATAPHPDVAGASGFVTINVAPLLAALGDAPIAGGVTLAQLGASMQGPVSAAIPAGSIDLQVHAPLKDPKPAQTIIDHCDELPIEHPTPPTPGACRLALQASTALELDAWVAANELRFAAHKDKRASGDPAALTTFGRELATGDWTLAFWGRGTMTNLSGVAPATTDLPPETAVSVHLIALVNELGAGMKVDKDGVSFRAMVRTVFANPPAIADPVAAFTGNDIIKGTANDPAKKIADGAPGSLFATDFKFGQGGLMIPAAAIGISSAVLVPALMRMMGGGAEATPDDPTAGMQPMDKSQLVQLLCQLYVQDAFPKWQAEHKGQQCPDKLEDLQKYLGVEPDIPTLTDPWNHPLIMKCGKDGLRVMSAGPDGKEGTADDISS